MIGAGVCGPWAAPARWWWPWWHAWPRSTVVQGIVWPSDQSQLRVEEAGFVDRVVARDGQMVRVGDVVLQLVSPQLQSELARQSAHLGALEAELVNVLPGRQAQGSSSGGGADARAGDAQAELAQAQSELAVLQERAQLLVVRSQVAGQLVLPGASDLPEQFLRRGYLLGQVLDGSPPRVRVAMPEHLAGQLEASQLQVSVRMRGSAARQHPAQLLRDSAGAVMQLPSAALSTRHGGDIVTDPQDADARKPLEPVVVLDVQLDGPADQAEAATRDAAGRRIGERAWVRFSTPAMPAALQIVQGLRAQLLRRFNPQN